MSSTEYAREMTRLSVAKILHTIGYHTSNTSPLEILTDIAAQYIRSLGKMTNDHANLYNFSEANLDHLALTFHHYHVNLPELEEYISNVDMGGPPLPCPNFPISKENHLNFLKPGSKECVTRPVHIHEHLPPMYNMNEVVNENEPEPLVEEQIQDEKQENMSTVFKRPAEILANDNFKRPRLVLEEEGRPTREISSVMMTTSGFISPAREGKLPESRTPLATIESTPAPNVTPPVTNPTVTKVKPAKRVEKKKEKSTKEVFKTQEEKPKKAPTVKEPKIKANSEKQNVGNEPRNLKFPNPLNNKINKTLAAARLKTEKCNTTITPVLPPENVKLSSEPDRKKANIFRKISAKADKSESKMRVKDEKPDSRETSPLLIIDEPFLDSPVSKFNLLSDITVEVIPKTEPKPQINPPIINQERYFSDDSPPGTPLTPKTPEMVSHSPPLTKDKKRREKAPKIKKVSKQTVDLDFNINVRPKTPEVADMFQPMPFPPFAAFPPPLGPGLIPQAPLFPGMPLAALGMPRMRPPYPSAMISPNLMDLPIPPMAAPIVIDDDEEEAPKHEKKPKEHKKEKKDKVKKKNKKDKVKDKAEKKKLKEEKKEKIKKEKKEKKKDKEQRDTDVLVPKLTLKLGSPAPSVSTESDRKLNIKPIVKKEEDEPRANHQETVREVSPELAKISALVTGQPKPKVATTIIQNDPYPPSGDMYHSQMKKSMFKPIPKKEPEPIPAVFQPPPSRYIEAVIEDPVMVTTPTKHQGPGRPRIHPVKQKTVKAHKQLPPQPPQQQVPIKDAEGNEVWICPACGKQDDGSPMIGCDDCDAWYHWVCVGIQVPPDDNENWYCRHCLAKKQEVHQSDKKKKRKKREKKEH